MVPPGDPAARVDLFAKDSLLLMCEDDSAPRAGVMGNTSRLENLVTR